MRNLMRNHSLEFEITYTLYRELCLVLDSFFKKDEENKEHIVILVDNWILKRSKLREFTCDI